MQVNLSDFVASLNDVAAQIGYEFRKSKPWDSDIPIELSPSEVDAIKYVHTNNLTMASVLRSVHTVKACRYLVENNIPGDFVECGVWRGGQGILAKIIFEQLGSGKLVWMYDTFKGMTQPEDIDVLTSTGTPALSKFQASIRDDYVDWSYCSRSDVENNISSSGIDISGIRLIEGDVETSLDTSENLPKQISYLRLDTDWYKSTMCELTVLFPLLLEGGILCVDDYGHWNGARRATDEFFLQNKICPLLSVIDRTARFMIK